MSDTSSPLAGDELVQSNGEATAGSNGEARSNRRRATAQSMAASQKEISVSEFFAKNRHLLGFDNPRKALLTTVKEAVDNALDACEEAGILPEIWVHIERVGEDRFKVGVQDNGPGILRQQIPLIFGKLLYGSKFHRMRMSRGQQGIGISAAGMYGLLTTGKPVKIMSKVSKRSDAHYYELQIDTKRNRPEILNGKGEGVVIEPNDKGRRDIEKHEIEWIEVDHGTRVTIELEARYQRGRGSVDDYLEQTAMANPHVTLHYVDPDGGPWDRPRVTDTLPPEPREIKPHPYGVELGRLVGMLKETKAPTVGQFLIQSFSRVSPSVARKICEGAKIGVRSSPVKCGRQEADAMYQAIQQTKIPAPATDCLVPIGEELILKGLHQLIPGEFYAAATRPPSVYRGNPFLIEVGLAFGGTSAAQRISREGLQEMLDASDARTLRQFLSSSFDGIGAEAADKIIAEAGMRPRVSPGKLEPEEITKLHEAMRNVNLNEGQSMNILRYANRVPLQFQAARLRDHANGDGHELAVLRAEPVARLAAQRSGDADGPHGQRVGAVHERIEGGRGELSGDSEGTAAGLAVGGPQAGDVPPAARPREARRAAAADFPALPGRGGRRRERHQQVGPHEALRAAVGSGEEADCRGRRAT